MQNVEEKNIYCLTSWQNTNICKNYEIIIFFIFAEIQTIAFYQICFNLFMQNLWRRKYFSLQTWILRDLTYKLKLKGLDT